MTDFILSVEIVIIALGTVTEEALLTQVLVVSLIALVATVGVYGLVALIVRMDEFGAKLINLNDKKDSISDKIGQFLINALPKVVKGLSIIGTLALLLVSGGIFVHNIHYIHDLFHNIPSIIVEFLTGLVVGFLVLLIIKVAGITGRIRGMKTKTSDGRSVRPELVILDRPTTRVERVGFAWGQGMVERQ